MRNVGNIIPNADTFDPTNPSTEPGLLELGLKVNNIRHLVICGHGDCKAMHVLNTLRNEAHSSENLKNLTNMPIKAWLLK